MVVGTPSVLAQRTRKKKKLRSVKKNKVLKDKEYLERKTSNTVATKCLETVNKHEISTCIMRVMKAVHCLVVPSSSSLFCGGTWAKLFGSRS